MTGARDLSTFAIHNLRLTCQQSGDRSRPPRKQPARYPDKVRITAIKKPFNNEFIEASAATPSQSATNSSAIAEDD